MVFLNHLEKNDLVKKGLKYYKGGTINSTIRKTLYTLPSNEPQVGQ